MVKGIVKDVIGELFETGQAIGQQVKQVSPGNIVKSAVEQISGSSSSGSSSGDIPPGLEDLKNKKIPPGQLNQMKQTDLEKQKKEIDNTRLGLNRLIMQRYARIQQDVLSEERNKEQEALEKQREEVDKAQQKQLGLEEEQKGGALLPKGPNKKGLGIFQEQLKGSRERNVAKMG